MKRGMSSSLIPGSVPNTFGGTHVSLEGFCKAVGLQVDDL